MHVGLGWSFIPRGALALGQIPTVWFRWTAARTHVGIPILASRLSLLALAQAIGADLGAAKEGLRTNSTATRNFG